MATRAQIEAALATAQANRLTWSEKADLLEDAMTTALLPDGVTLALPAFMVSSDGTSASTMTLEAAGNLALKWRNMDTGGIVPQYVEFHE